MVAASYFALVIVALHLLRPERDPIALTTSTYAVGRYGALMTSAFIAMSVASAALGAALYRALPQATSRLGLTILGVWSAALLVAAAFPIDVGTQTPTTSGTIHAINGRIAFTSATLASIFITRRLRQHDAWRSAGAWATTLALVMLALYVMAVVVIAAGLGYAGLVQRLFLAAFVGWLGLLALRLRGAAAPDTLAPPAL